jgi:Domain of unknown function DUF11
VVAPTSFSDTRLEIALPDGLTYERSYIDRGECSRTSTGSTCDTAWISAGVETHVTIWALVAKAGELDVTATVRSLLEPDLNPANNSVTLKLLPASTGGGGGGGGGGGTTPTLTRPTKVSGTDRVGHLLRAVAPAWTATPSRLTYQWLLCRATLCKPIAGATQPTLKLLPGYAGGSVKLMATGTFGSANLRSSSKPVPVRR